MRSFTTSLIAAAAVTAAAGLAPASASAADMRLMTGPQGGVWIPLGGQLKDMWEKAIPGLSVTSMPGAGIANVRGIEEGKAEVGFGNSISTVDGVARQCAVHEAAQEGLQPREPLSAIFPGHRSGERRHQLDQGPQGQDGRGAAARQHRRDHHPAHAQGERALLQRGQAELHLLHRRGRADEGRQRPGLHARHHDPLRRRHGSRLGARHQAPRSLRIRSRR